MIKMKKLLDIGCGNNKYREEGYESYGIDKYKTPCVDKLWDGEVDKIPYPDNFFDKIVSFVALEHIRNFKNVIKEIWRVAKPNALVHIEVPNFRSFYAYSEEHERFFTIDSFSYLMEGRYGNWIYKERFNILRNDFQMVVNPKSKIVFLRIFNPIINTKLFKYLYRDFFSLLINPAGLEFDLEVVK